MRQHKNQNKKRFKKALCFNIEDTKQRIQIRAVEVRITHLEKHYEDRNNLFFESIAHSKPLKI